jgi:hypothetical protein
MRELQETALVRKPFKPWQWWVVFGLATFVMSLGFQAFRDFTVTPTLRNGCIWLGVMLLLALLLTVLIFDSYVQEKARGKVERSIRLFDWMMDFRKKEPKR